MARGWRDSVGLEFLGEGSILSSRGLEDLGGASRSRFLFGAISNARQKQLEAEVSREGEEGREKKDVFVDREIGSGVFLDSGGDWEMVTPSTSDRRGGSEVS